MKRILIAGGGFAGLWAAKKLCGTPDIETVLVDAHDASEMLPVLPDIVGRSFAPDHVRYPLGEAARRWGFRFVQDEIVSIDLDKPGLTGKAGAYEADALLIATGSETTFHGQDQLAEVAYTLDSVKDAVRLRDAADAGQASTFVVAGGAYTGVEIATALWRRMRKAPMARQIYLVELQDRLCPSLPTEFSQYVEDQVRELGIILCLGTVVTEADSQTVTLKDGRSFDDAMLVWAAGVHTPAPVRNLGLESSGQSRLPVDACLRIAPKVFAAGDSAGFLQEGKPLRMGVQFSISQGARAAGNILRVLAGKEPAPFVPHDPGYVVPLASGKGIGKPLGLPLKGRLPIALHYLMSAFRSIGVRNRAGLLWDALTG